MATSFTNCTALVVDDSKTILTMMTALLHKLGFGSVAVVETVDAAIERVAVLDSCPFDVVFMDRYLGQGSWRPFESEIRESQ